MNDQRLMITSGLGAEVWVEMDKNLGQMAHFSSP